LHKGPKNMKRLGLDANSTSLPKKIYWKIVQEASPSQNSVSALRWVISKLVTLVVSWFCNQPVVGNRKDYITRIGQTSTKKFIVIMFWELKL